jgi:hypothetical protein
VDIPVLPSTFFLTLLLMVGLFFFIRGSVKDRTEQILFTTSNSEDSLLKELRDYFDKRAYGVKAIEPEQNIVRLEGFVRPSIFLAIFLSLLAALGFFCLALVLSIQIPALKPAIFSLLLLAPGAGVFYWRNAGRLEQVSFKVDAVDDRTQLLVKGHRDELLQLQQTLSFLEKQEP